MAIWTFWIFCQHFEFPNFSPEIDISVLEITTKYVFIPKWLPRPNHSARSIRLEFLCRTPVSKFRDLSCESKSNLKTPNIVSQPECQLELPGDGGGDSDGVPTTLPIWQEPWSITCRDQISRSGIDHFDINVVIKQIYGGPCDVSRKQLVQCLKDFHIHQQIIIWQWPYLQFLCIPNPQSQESETHP